MAVKQKKFESVGGREISGSAAPRLDPPSIDGSITRMIGWPVEAWLRCQEGVLKAAEPAATGWIERRREGAYAVFSTFEKLAKCSDLQEAASIQRDWLEGTMRRLDSDLHAFADQAVALSHEAMAATRYAAQTSTEIVNLTAQAASRNDEVVEQAA
jgi:hypothetical protein